MTEQEQIKLLVAECCRHPRAEMTEQEQINLLAAEVLRLRAENERLVAEEKALLRMEDEEFEIRMCNQARADERERCAKLVEEEIGGERWLLLKRDIAAEIRKLE